jgi:hypothetical protein
MGGVIGHFELASDELADPGHRPQLTSEPVRCRTLQQQLGEELQVGIGQAGRVARRPTAAERRDATLPEVRVLAVDALAGHAEPAGDLSLADAGGEQLSRAQPTGLQLLMIKTPQRSHDREPAIP